MHNLLRFQQHGGPQVKLGIDEFKNFCQLIHKNDDPVERGVQLQVLKQYCDDQSFANGKEVDFPDLLSTWAFAAQSSHEAILSAAPAALSQFFRAISSEIDFREFGLSLCQSLLRRDQTRLFDQGLSSPKHKDFLISPCLRLLTEIVGFDGGAMVGNVFSRRDILLKRLDTLLEPPSKVDDGGRHGPTVRSNAVRLLLVLLKYLDADSKAEMVAQAKSIHSCFKSLHVDNSRLVLDVLGATRIHLVNADLPRESRRRLLNSSNLGVLTGLYDFEEDGATEDSSEQHTSVRDAIHDFLVYVCTSERAVYMQETGWYPTRFNAEPKTANDGDAIDLGLDSPYYSDDYSMNVPIKNTTLSTFLQKLKPAIDTLQAELTIKIFQRAPELVADYFCKRNKSLGTPTDDSEWRGQFAFLFSIVNLPVPKHCGWQGGLPALPPPLSIVVESIVPRQLDRSTLNQCLKSDDSILKISAARILEAVMRKLDNVLKVFHSAKKELWVEGLSKLREMVASRVPHYSEVVAAVQASEGDYLVRESLFECMAGWNLSTATYDVGPAVQGVLQHLRSDHALDEIHESYMRQLASLMRIYGASRITKWSTSVDLLAFIALQDELRMASQEHLMPKLLEKGVLQSERAFWALLDALRASTSGSQDMSVPQSLENCITRVAKQPVKYLETAPAGNVSLLACCLAEQWAYLERDSSLRVGLFAAQLFARFEVISENKEALDHLRRAFSTSPAVTKEIQRLKLDPPNVAFPEVREAEQASESREAPLQPQALDLASTFAALHPIPASLKGLSRWDNVDFESELHAPATSRLAYLMLSLSSPSEELRLSAHQSLLQITHQVQSSSYDEKDQLYLLLGELTETSHEHTLSSPATSLPTLIPSLAIFLLTIITNPSDPMYTTANKFLMRQPTWTPLTRLIPYWTNVILLSEPDSDDPAAPVLSVNRFLDFLVSGLRTPLDLDLYRKSGIFERVCSLYLAPATRRDTRKKVLQLLHQAITVEDGSGADTLITRVGIRAWFAIVKERERESELGRIVTALEQELEQKKGKEYIQRWEQGRPILKWKEQDVEMQE